jgi:cellulose synthase/poly-beta-1,6-N-acetylglucosamine synthase-like glycosyltransferase
MLTGLAILISGAALALLVPVLILLAEILSAVTSRAQPLPQGRRARVAVVIPAHDEASVIVPTLRALRHQLQSKDRLIVVADNCTDDTALLAAAQGAEVLTRRNLTHRGKGYALDWGIRHLVDHPPEVVLIVDADCHVTAGAVDRLARVCAEMDRPVQALYLMRAGPDAGLSMRISEFAWLIKNKVRPMGLQRLGLPCQLMGTGMAFPWRCISTAKLATGHITEDLKLGLELVRAGTPPVFAPEAVVTSEFPTSQEAVRSQRTRWEHGHLNLIVVAAPRLLLSSLIKPNINGLALALDLIVPPISLLLLFVMAVWITAMIFFITANSLFPLAAATMAAVLLVLSILLAWAVYARHIIALGGLAFGTIHAIVKIPLYCKFIVARQLSWVRSKRSKDSF